ncbi:hypothetical protein CRM22_008289 [Opisthorchis felineus]|uniref:Uncharacterized protein n=1 Tax=Opisthorchis felineus TaxID=147828 RepID=A0A4S2LCK8_OPIFE|nr:hypothetical protein CRM22_008289 [Opisthorchis felineus]TGZ60891.1 hypothetical protein CRM22_008289 [Opisthorchis felineus]
MGQTSTKGNGYYTWSQNQPSFGGDKNICKQRLTRERVDSDEPDKDHYGAVKDKQIFSSTKRALTNWIVEEAPNYIVRVKNANKGKGYKDVHADLLSTETGITQNGNPVTFNPGKVHRPSLLRTSTSNKNSDCNPNEKTNLIELTDEEEM